MKIKLILDKFDTKQLKELKKLTGKTSFELLKMGLRLLNDKLCGKEEVKTVLVPYANFGFPWWQYYKPVYDTKYTIKAVKDTTADNPFIQPIWPQEPYSLDKIYRHPDLGPEPYQYTTINPSWVTGPTYTAGIIYNRTDYKFDPVTPPVGSVTGIKFY